MYVDRISIYVCMYAGSITKKKSEEKGETPAYGQNAPYVTS